MGNDRIVRVGRMADRQRDQDEGDDRQYLGHDPVGDVIRHHVRIGGGEDGHHRIGEDMQVLLAEREADEHVPEEVQPVDDRDRHRECAEFPVKWRVDCGDEAAEDRHAPDAGTRDDDRVRHLHQSRVLGLGQEDERVPVGFLAGDDFGMVADQTHQEFGVAGHRLDERPLDRGDRLDGKEQKPHRRDRTREHEQRVPAAPQQIPDVQRERHSEDTPDSFDDAALDDREVVDEAEPKDPEQDPTGDCDGSGLLAPVGPLEDGSGEERPDDEPGQRAREPRQPRQPR
jgi:hypothetical protein